MTDEQVSKKAEEDRLHNIEVAKSASWIHALFRENNLSVEDKQEVFRRLGKHLHKQELKAS